MLFVPFQRISMKSHSSRGASGIELTPQSRSHCASGSNMMDVSVPSATSPSKRISPHDRSSAWPAAAAATAAHNTHGRPSSSGISASTATAVASAAMAAAAAVRLGHTPHKAPSSRLLADTDLDTSLELPLTSYLPTSPTKYGSHASQHYAQHTNYHQVASQLFGQTSLDDASSYGHNATNGIMMSSLASYNSHRPSKSHSLHYFPTDSAPANSAAPSGEPHTTPPRSSAGHVACSPSTPSGQGQSVASLLRRFNTEHSRPSSMHAAQHHQMDWGKASAIGGSGNGSSTALSTGGTGAVAGELPELSDCQRAQLTRSPKSTSSPAMDRYGHELDPQASCTLNALDSAVDAADQQNTSNGSPAWLANIEERLGDLTSQLTDLSLMDATGFERLHVQQNHALGALKQLSASGKEDTGDIKKHLDKLLIAVDQAREETAAKLAQVLETQKEAAKAAVSQQTDADRSAKPIGGPSPAWPNELLCDMAAIKASLERLLQQQSDDASQKTMAASVHDSHASLAKSLEDLSTRMSAMQSALQSSASLHSGKAPTICHDTHAASSPTPGGYASYSNHMSGRGAGEQMIDRPTKNLMVSMNEKLIQLSKLYEHMQQSLLSRMSTLEERLVRSQTSMQSEQIGAHGIGTRLEKLVVEVRSDLTTVNDRVAKLGREQTSFSASTTGSLGRLLSAMDTLIDGHHSTVTSDDDRGSTSSGVSSAATQLNAASVVEGLAQIRHVMTKESENTSARMSQLLNMYGILQEAHAQLASKVGDQVSRECAVAAATQADHVSLRQVVGEVRDSIRKLDARLDTVVQALDQQRPLPAGSAHGGSSALGNGSSSVGANGKLLESIHSTLVNYLPLDLEQKLASIDAAVRDMRSVSSSSSQAGGWSQPPSASAGGYGTNQQQQQLLIQWQQDIMAHNHRILETLDSIQHSVGQLQRSSPSSSSSASAFSAGASGRAGQIVSLDSDPEIKTLLRELKAIALQAAANQSSALRK
ncbi:hypothetical protein BC831DRAFT_315881 [Entophlyctis helioformis]|nr:hypothetical protein BC831DRAFT_315881 [Entophlyctis helioformis]